MDMNGKRCSRSGIFLVLSSGILDAMVVMVNTSKSVPYLATHLQICVSSNNLNYYVRAP